MTGEAALARGTTRGERSGGVRAGNEAGLLLRFTADTIAMAPPFISSEEEIVKMTESLRSVLRHIA